jgi:hypothetical protein
MDATLSESMILFALRYCLVSSSYAPETCAMYLIDHWWEFTHDLQAQIMAEIQKRLATGIRDEVLAQVWEGVLLHAEQWREQRILLLISLLRMYVEDSGADDYIEVME